MKTIQYVYLHPKTPVYAVVRKRNYTTRSTETSYWSAPFKHNESNVIVTFTSQHAATITSVCLDEHVESSTLESMSYTASIMKMPLVVSTNSFCDVESKEVVDEIFYTSRVLYIDENY
jgi:hypothetical protein